LAAVLLERENVHMSYTRRISVADAASAGYPHYLAGMPVGIESATVVTGDGPVGQKWVDPSHPVLRRW
jgi:hypothetical protein